MYKFSKVIFLLAPLTAYSLENKVEYINNPSDPFLKTAKENFIEFWKTKDLGVPKNENMSYLEKR